MIGHTARALARDVAVSGQGAYLYYFSYPGKGATAPFGAYHTIDTAFVAGGHFRKSRWGGPDAEDWRLAEVMSGYRTNFASTGDPNRTGLPPWPAYAPVADLCLGVGRKITALSQREPESGTRNARRTSRQTRRGIAVPFAVTPW